MPTVKSPPVTDVKSHEVIVLQLLLPVTMTTTDDVCYSKLQQNAKKDAFRDTVTAQS